MALPAGRRGIRANLVRSDGTIGDLTDIKEDITDIKEDITELNNDLANISWGNAVSISSGQTSPYTGLLFLSCNPSDSLTAYAIVDTGGKTVRANSYGGFAEYVYGPVSKGDLVRLSASSENARVSMLIIPLVIGN